MADQLMAGRRDHASTESRADRRPGSPHRAKVNFGVAVVLVGIWVLLAVLSHERSERPVAEGPAVIFASSRGDIQIPTPLASQTPAGVPDRATRSKAGAVNAAAKYASLLADLFPLDAARARSVVADDASDASREKLIAAINANLIPLQQQAAGMPGVTTYRQAVLATHLESYSADAPATAGPSTQAAAAAGASARVTVWTLLTVSQTPPGPVETNSVGDVSGDDTSNAVGSFATIRLTLVWERAAWRIDDSVTLEGPTPLIDGTPSTGAELNLALKGFVDWRP